MRKFKLDDIMHAAVLLWTTPTNSDWILLLQGATLLIFGISRHDIQGEAHSMNVVA